MKAVYVIRGNKGGYFSGINSNSNINSALKFESLEECKMIFHLTPEEFCLIDKIYVP
jgi:hypothetical protein